MTHSFTLQFQHLMFHVQQTEKVKEKRKMKRGIYTIFSQCSLEIPSFDGTFSFLMFLGGILKCFLKSLELKS